MEILSVDDDPMNHLVLRNILKNSSYTVIEADCGEQALKFLADRYQVGKLEALPSIILMDVMMPGLNGFQTTEKIREMFPEALLPIIMISATASEDSICRGFRAGCNDYLSKPIKVLPADGPTPPTRTHQSDLCPGAHPPAGCP